MPQAYISLGGNVGESRTIFAQALDELDSLAGCRLAAVSGFNVTRPIGDAAGASEFLNAAAHLETVHSPGELLAKLQALEERAGRKRIMRWGPRTLDLDLIFLDDLVIETQELTLPHPACWYRRFVLDPLAEIAPHVVHPVKGLAVAGLRERLTRRPLRIALAGGAPAVRNALKAGLQSVSNELCVEIRHAERLEPTDPEHVEPAIIAWLGAPGKNDPGPASFDELPLLARLDASQSADPANFLANVVRSALG